ncbi:uncharacterized protein Tco025E_00546 [Trypanosoma conorhini]|uniref:Uncharacterized protein n=1 Tax=Trypanosoma conorhini TaxID=83891 RepID=A0A3R7LLV3_9TRYP|nr:uncharacterized protein Tco025E_00546 [Trypanosoma conorhini]RNF27238.1 hypothetical protein Tco025E_00546 [Trypanosoma conorhini]
MLASFASASSASALSCVFRLLAAAINRRKFFSRCTALSILPSSSCTASTVAAVSSTCLRSLLSSTASRCARFSTARRDSLASNLMSVTSAAQSNGRVLAGGDSDGDPSSAPTRGAVGLCEGSSDSAVVGTKKRKKKAHTQAKKVWAEWKAAGATSLKAPIVAAVTSEGKPL